MQTPGQSAHLCQTDKHVMQWTPHRSLGATALLVGVTIAAQAEARPQVLRVVPLDPARVPVRCEAADSGSAEYSRRYELHCPGSIRRVLLDRARHTVYVRWSGDIKTFPTAQTEPPRGDAKKDAGFVGVLDADSGKLMWAARTNATNDRELDTDHVLLMGPDSMAVLTRSTGSLSPRIAATARVLWPQRIWAQIRHEPDTAALNSVVAEVEPRESLPLSRRTAATELKPRGGRKTPASYLSGYDITSGAPLWRRSVDESGVLDYLPQDTARGAPLWCMSGQSLERVDAQDGHGWHLDRSTMERQHGKPLPRSVALSSIGLARSVAFSGIGLAMAFTTGTGFVGGVGPEIAHHLGSLPLVQGRHLYWVAGDEVLCCDADSGSVRWSTRLTGPRGAYALSSYHARLLVVGRGCRHVGNRLESATNAGLRRLDPENGAIVAQWKPADATPILEWLELPAAVYLMTNASVFRFDDSLKVIAQYRAPKNCTLISMTWAGNRPVLRTTAGVTGLSADSLRADWEQPLEPLIVDHTFYEGLTRERRPLDLKEAYGQEDEWATMSGVAFTTKDSWKPAAYPRFLARFCGATPDLGHGAVWVNDAQGISCIDARDGRRVSQLRLSALRADGMHGDWIGAISGDAATIVLTGANAGAAESQ